MNKLDRVKGYEEFYVYIIQLLEERYHCVVDRPKHHNLQFPSYVIIRFKCFNFQCMLDTRIEFNTFMCQYTNQEYCDIDRHFEKIVTDINNILIAYVTQESR